MEHQEGYLKGVRDTDIYYQCWLPKGEPKAHPTPCYEEVESSDQTTKDGLEVYSP